MIEMNFMPKDEVDSEKDPLVDDPVPTYEEWLTNGAEKVFNHPAALLVKAAIGLVKYLWTRERLLIELLVQKDIIQQHEIEEHFGDKAHESCSKEGVKQLTKTLVRASAQGKLKGPKGDVIAPDDVLVILNDILDLNDTGWNGRTLEIIADMFDKDDLRADYEKEIASIKECNERRAEERETQAKQKALELKMRVERERRVRIYISQCRVFDKPFPTAEEQRQMVEGKTPIPRAA